MDTKYVFNIKHLASVLEQLKADFFVLEVECKRKCGYKTLYFDTEEFLCYYQHQHGKLNRTKIRIRRYEDTKQHFLEVKFKNNHSKTIKDRILLSDEIFKIKKKQKSFILKRTGLEPSKLKPMLWVNYSRISLINKDFNERLTIDLDLSFATESNALDCKNLVVLELKQSKSAKSPVKKILRDLHVMESSLSKYCTGIALLYPEVKTNNIKEKLRFINKLCYENI
jgi:hypothetical protein